MLKLLRNVRKAYKQWKALPSGEREQFSSDVQHIRGLVRELGGSRAVRFVESDAEESDAGVDEMVSSARGREAVIADLKEATTVLLAKMAAPAGRFASDSTPRSVRLGGRAVSAGVRRLDRKRRQA
jgi:hypothetical protein